MAHASAAAEEVSPCNSDPRHEEPKVSFETFKSKTRFLYAERDSKHGQIIYGLCNRCDSTIGFEMSEPMPSSSLIW
jgi:hypothetical protein